MAVGGADIVKSVVTLWNSSGLETQFKNLWAAADRTEFPALNDTEAEGAHPFPYCVFEVMQGSTKERNSSGGHQKFEIRNVALSFVVHSRDMADGRSAKQVAAAMIEEIMKVYGGHPTVANQMDGRELDYGHILSSTLQNDWSIRENYENNAWKLMYNLVADVPVAL